MAMTRLRRLGALLAVAALLPWPLLLTHGNWWAFILVAGTLVVVLRLVIGQQWTKYAGLALSRKQAVLAAIVFAMVAIGSRLLLPLVYEAAALKVKAPAIEDQMGFMFQAFNEEILFRALMIGFILQYVRSTYLISLGLALIFAAAHFLLYRFGTLQMALSMPALATLFLAGVAMNYLYLAFRHIGFSWALHAGWNMVWLPATFYDATTNGRLREPEIFDRVLGTPAIVAAAAATALLSFALLRRRSVKVATSP